MTRKKAVKFDLNNDGVFDKKDKSLAAKVLRAKLKEEPKVEELKVEELKVEESKVEEIVKNRFEDYVNYLKIDEERFQGDCPKCGVYINSEFKNPICPACKEKL